MTNGLMQGMDDSPESIAGRVKELRERSKLSMEQMAKAMGYRSASGVQRYENPDKLNRGYLKRDFVAKLERALLGKGSPPIQRAEIWELAGPEFTFSQMTQPNAVIGDRITSSRRLIHVYGSAVAGIDGEFEMNGAILYDTMSPPTLTEVSEAYAVQVSGESMEPRYFDGELAYIDPTRRVTKGNFVVAQVQLEEEGPILAFIKRFIRHNAEELVLEQFNPPKELRFDHKTVKAVHLVVMSGAA